jgi:hypothetical protein
MLSTSSSAKPSARWNAATSALVRRICRLAAPSPDTSILHELVHPLVQTDFPRAPSWFEEGIAALFEKPSSTRPASSTARTFCQWLDGRGLLWPFYRAWRDGVAEDAGHGDDGGAGGCGVAGVGEGDAVTAERQPAPSLQIEFLAFNMRG